MALGCSSGVGTVTEESCVRVLVGYIAGCGRWYVRWLDGSPYERMCVSCVVARAGCWVWCWVLGMVLGVGYGAFDGMCVGLVGFLELRTCVCWVGCW